MTKKTRTILFLICLFLFLLIAPLAILYSQGYRIDFNPPADGKIITQTGGFFLKAAPKQVEIYFDGKLKKKTDFFFGSALIENLLPKEYKIEVKKQEYHSWEKTLGLKEKEVTEAKNIVLFPKNPNFTILSKQVKDFWFSPDQRKIVLKEESQSTDEKTEWFLKLYELNKEIKSRLIDEKDIFSKGADLLGLNFSADSKKIFLNIGMMEQEKYFSLEIDKIPPNLTEKEPSLPSFENILVEQELNNDIYYLDSFGNLFKNQEKLSEESFHIKPETEYILKAFTDFIFLQEAQTLYQFNPDLKYFEKFAEGINSLKISPDSKKIVYFSNYEIWILFLKEKLEAPAKKAGEKLFLIRLSEKIKDIFWLNSHYLVFNTEDKIKITEIDERNRINIIDVVEFKNLPEENSSEELLKETQIFWNKTDNKLYILSNENLYRSTALIP